MLAAQRAGGGGVARRQRRARGRPPVAGRAGGRAAQGQAGDGRPEEAGVHAVGST